MTPNFSLRCDFEKSSDAWAIISTFVLLGACPRIEPPDGNTGDLPLTGIYVIFGSSSISA